MEKFGEFLGWNFEGACVVEVVECGFRGRSMATVTIRGNELIVDLDSPDDGEAGTKHWLLVAREDRMLKRRAERRAEHLRRLKERIMQRRS